MLRPTPLGWVLICTLIADAVIVYLVYLALNATTS
mgnify:FL=1